MTSSLDTSSTVLSFFFFYFLSSIFYLPSSIFYHLSSSYLLLLSPVCFLSSVFFFFLLLSSPSFLFSLLSPLSVNMLAQGVLTQTFCLVHLSEPCLCQPVAMGLRRKCCWNGPSCTPTDMSCSRESSAVRGACSGMEGDQQTRSFHHVAQWANPGPCGHGGHRGSCASHTIRARASTNRGAE